MANVTLTQAGALPMIEEVQELMDQYWSWLRDRTSLRAVGGWIEITTPYLDRHNDYLQIYARRHDDGWLLADDGYVINDLEQSGCNISSPKRKAMLNSTLAGFGVQYENGRLVVQASPTDFALRKHNLVQAMLSVGNLFYPESKKQPEAVLRTVNRPPREREQPC